jgi:DNA-directed RNA polymerase
MDDFERELILEAEMIGLGRSRMWSAVSKAREDEAESQTKYAHRMMSGDGKTPGDLEFFIVAVTKFLKDAKGTPGRHHSLVPVLEQFDSPAVVAFIALKEIFDCITKRKDLTHTAIKVGKVLEDELRFKKFETENPALWGTLKRDLHERNVTNLQRRRGILIHEMLKDAKQREAMVWQKWTVETHLILGLRCIDLLEHSTNLIHTRLRRKGKKTIGKIEATTETLEWIAGFMERGGIIAPCFLPTVITPRRWKSPVGGGYHLKTLNSLRLVKVMGERGNDYLKMLAQKPEQMRGVYNAVNTVQSTPWTINKPVLAVMQQAMKAQLEIGKAPMCLASKDAQDADLDAKMPLPSKPADIKTNEDARKAWSREAAKMYEKRVKALSKSLQHVQLMWLAEKFQDEPTIYFPMQLDFRGRMYAVPSNLNPQGTDCAKGLLQFARGCKLGKSGWRWLHIHLANMWGEDKISFDEREQWAVENYHWIVDCVHEPFEHREWMKADKGEKAWQFLAGAIELVAAVESGDYENFFSHLPVTVDGTCNGLQHFSALLLDEDGAISVNLKPSDLPHDIYQIVADKVRMRFMGMADNTLAKLWLAWGFDRKATKRAVMIVPYSGTIFAAKDYTLEYLQSRPNCPFEEDDEIEAADFFALHVWSAIAETVVSARQAMDWFRKLAQAVTAKNQPMQWTTPIGFPVQQDYRDSEQYRVHTRLGEGVTFRPVLLRETDLLDKRKSAQGISPNVIHSLDANCLMLTVNRCKDEGVEDFAMVHDSYGVLAGHMETMYMALRQAFVDSYQHDVMSAFAKSSTARLTDKQRGKLPVAPAKGSFELESVKESKYFFA